METVASAAHPCITIDYQICHGQPVVRGLRYPVWYVLEIYRGATAMVSSASMATGARLLLRVHRPTLMTP